MGRYPRYLPFVPLTVAPPDCRILPVRTVIGHRIAADGAVGIRSAELVPRPVVGLSVAVFIGHHPHHARFGTPGELVAGYREIVPAIPTRRLDAVVEAAGLDYIDFVKVQTGVNIQGGAGIGELSTEVSRFRDENL